MIIVIIFIRLMQTLKFCMIKYPRLNSDVVSGLRTEQLCLLIQGWIQVLLCHLGVCPVSTALLMEVLWQCSLANQKPCCDGCFSSRNCCNLRWIKHSIKKTRTRPFCAVRISGLTVATCPHHRLLAVLEEPSLSCLFWCPLFSSEYTHCHADIRFYPWIFATSAMDLL